VLSPQSFAFWVEALVGLIIPLAILLTPEFATSGRWLLISSIMVIAGLVINRMNVAVVGITSTYGATYYPHWMEVDHHGRDRVRRRAGLSRHLQQFPGLHAGTRRGRQGPAPATGILAPSGGRRHGQPQPVRRRLPDRA
jgi:hypothetical protein